MPLSPAHTLSQTSSTFSPIEVTRPRPVMTTLRLAMNDVYRSENRSKNPRGGAPGGVPGTRGAGPLLAGVFLDVIDRLSDGLDFFRFLVGDRKLEFVLELHDEFYGV